jgi:hypothetical protein
VSYCENKLYYYERFREIRKQCSDGSQRPYAMLKAPVPSITVVKQHWAQSVLGWVTAYKRVNHTKDWLALLLARCWSHREEGIKKTYAICVTRGFMGPLGGFWPKTRQEACDRLETTVMRPSGTRENKQTMFRWQLYCYKQWPRFKQHAGRRVFWAVSALLRPIFSKPVSCQIPFKIAKKKWYPELKACFLTSLLQREAFDSFNVVINWCKNSRKFHFVLSAVPKKSEYLVLPNFGQICQVKKM